MTRKVMTRKVSEYLRVVDARATPSVTAARRYSDTLRVTLRGGAFEGVGL